MSGARRSDCGARVALKEIKVASTMFSLGLAQRSLNSLQAPGCIHAADLHNALPWPKEYPFTQPSDPRTYTHSQSFHYSNAAQVASQIIETAPLASSQPSLTTVMSVSGSQSREVKVGCQSRVSKRGVKIGISKSWENPYVKDTGKSACHESSQCCITYSTTNSNSTDPSTTIRSPKTRHKASR
jgi:hypothetical protein